MQQLKGLQYAITLDPKLRYYIMEILPESRDRTTIVTQFGKFGYNRVPMGLYV